MTRVCGIAAAFAVGAATTGAFAQPPNDNCSAAEAIAGYGVFNFDNALATTDGLPDGLCLAFGTSQIELDVWYCWTAPGGGPVSINTCGQTGVDTRIAVYDGCSCPSGSAILACNDDTCSTQSRVGFVAQAGHSYLIRMGVYPGAAGGAGTFTVESGILGGPLVFNAHTYYLLQPSSWTQAQAAAEALGGDLATINDAAENEWVRVELANFGAQDRRVWIGFNDVAQEGNFVWTSGQPVSYTNWNPGEPNNTNGLEHYTELFGSNGEWNDNTNAPAGLTVYGAVEMPAGCYPDCNLDGAITVQDFGCFQTKFVQGEPYADCNTDGSLTVQDFGCFQTKFVLGCP